MKILRLLQSQGTKRKIVYVRVVNTTKVALIRANQMIHGSIARKGATAKRKAIGLFDTVIMVVNETWMSQQIYPGKDLNNQLGV